MQRCIFQCNVAYNGGQSPNPNPNPTHLKVLVFLKNDGSVRFGVVRYGTVRFGAVRFGRVRYGDASWINSIEIFYSFFDLNLKMFIK